MGSRTEQQHARALQLYRSGRLAEALAGYRELCSRNHNDAQAWHMAGAIAAMSGDLANARAWSENAVRLAPDAYGPRINLAGILQSCGDIGGAMRHYHHILAGVPGDAQAQTRLAGLHALQHDYATAARLLQDVLQRQPAFAEAHNALGAVYQQTARPVEATASYQAAIRLRPDYVDALCNLGVVLGARLQNSAALACFQRALQLQPDNPAVLLALGNLHQSTGNYEQARQCYARALALSPDNPALRAAAAALHERCGDPAGASALLEPAIRAGLPDPDTAITWAKLCNRRGDADEASRVLQQALGNDPAPDKRIELLFALGEQYDRSGRYDEAFASFRLANELDTPAAPATDDTLMFRHIMQYFDRDRLPGLPRADNRSGLPVFIVGMPRSGTSLVEQILACHPQVHACGERSSIFSLIDALAPGVAFPDAVGSVTAETLNRLAATVLAELGALAGNRMRCTDKTPLHGLLLGFIQQLLPGCRVIVCNRDPLDTCLSIYFHRFNAGHAYARQLASLGVFHREYTRLMQYWMASLELPMLALHYEQLVHDPEQQVRRLLAFCELDWHAGCLAFHDSKRVVNTPSYDQVRRPLYSSSIGRWRHYQKHLAPLLAALQD